MGKGGRCPETRTGRYARCETPKPSWGSSALRRTLESRVLRKAHARFGEGRMEKCSWSNSPAAYSTSITAARRGTSSRISLGSSCPSDCETGLTGSDQRDLVLCPTTATEPLDRRSWGRPQRPEENVRRSGRSPSGRLPRGGRPRHYGVALDGPGPSR